MVHNVEKSLLKSLITFIFFLGGVGGFMDPKCMKNGGKSISEQNQIFGPFLAMKLRRHF